MQIIDLDEGIAVKTKIDYILLQSILQNATSIQKDSMISSKNDTLGACIKLYSEDSEMLFSTNDVALLKQYLPEPSWLEIECLKEQVYNRQQQWIRSKIELTSNLPNILLNCVSCLGEIRHFSIELMDTNRLDYIVHNNRKITKNLQKWGYADVSILVENSDFQIWIKRQIGFKPDDNIEAKLVNAIEKITKEYLQFIGLETIDINDHCDLILPSGQGGTLIHEAVGHPLEADHYFEPGSIFFNRINTKIAGENINIYDGFCGDNLIFSTLSDDGSPINDTTILVENGELVGLLSDATTSRLWGIPNTGHGRTESYAHPCMPRMRNTFIARGLDSPTEIIRCTQKGVYALDIGGGEVNMTSGDFIFNINAGVYIENGIPVKMVRPFLFRGNILKTLKQIDKIGDDLSFCFAMCGKKGQMIPVSYGSPTIRINNQSLGGYPE